MKDITLKKASGDGYVDINASDTGGMKVSIEAGSEVVVSGNVMELFGASTATRPLATAVPEGTTFIVVASPIIVYMSDGTNWVEVA